MIRFIFNKSNKEHVNTSKEQGYNFLNLSEMKLVLIYNANSNLGSRIIDYGHKVLSPSTYSCKLCALTHHNFGERKEWKQFQNQTNIELKFLHKDEFNEAKKLAEKNYPLILEELIDSHKIVLNSEDIQSIDSLKGLIQRLTEYAKNSNELL